MKITLSWGGSATYADGKIGQWRQEVIQGTQSLFCGRLKESEEWSPWMLKKELRQWFQDRIEEKEGAGE